MLWVAKIVLTLATSLIVGGGVALGALTAPVIFGRFERGLAGRTMTEIFRRFDRVLWICVLIVLLGEILLFSTSARPLSLLRGAASLSLVALGAYHARSLGPEIERRVATGATDGEEFEKLHQRSEAIFKTVTLLGAISLMLLALGY